MADTPYPNYPPSYEKVTKTGTFNRTCYVLELLTIEPLDPTRQAQLEDAISATVQRFVDVEKHDLVRPTRFDTQVRSALRL